jgi:hypothetical protein
MTKLEKLGRLWVEGLSARAISERLGLSESWVYKHRRRLGLPARQSPWVCERLTQKVVDAWRRGIEAEDIRTTYGLASKSVVIGKMHRLGFSGTNRIATRKATTQCGSGSPQ